MDKKQKSNLKNKTICAIVEKNPACYELVVYEAPTGKMPLSDWLDSLDSSIKGRVEARLDRLQEDLFGDIKALKDGLYEIKFKKPAFRIYYSILDKNFILLLLAGDKSGQQDDIKKAKLYLAEYRGRYENKKDD